MVLPYVGLNYMILLYFIKAAESSSATSM